ncbi:MAG TPA: hypothetical protein VF656_07200 [Pyrinomonadaceae bacterium]|jgi:hypothetical protein
MKTPVRISTLFTALLFSALSVWGQAAPHPHDSATPSSQGDSIDSETKPWNGRIDGQTYINEYFDLSATVPDGWFIHSKEAVEAVKRRGKGLIKPDDKQTVAAVEQSINRTLFLMTATPYTPGSRPVIGVQITAEPDPKGVLKTGADYLTQLKLMTTRIKLPFEIVKDIEPVMLAGRDFHVIQFKVLEGGVEKGQRFYATIKKGYALIFITTYTNEDERKATDKIVQMIRLN